MGEGIYFLSSFLPSFPSFLPSFIPVFLSILTYLIFFHGNVKTVNYIVTKVRIKLWLLLLLLLLLFAVVTVVAVVAAVAFSVFSVCLIVYERERPETSQRGYLSHFSKYFT